MKKHGKIPEAPGKHFDFEMTLNKFDKSNQLYSEQVFFTNDPCFTQLVDEYDHYLNILDMIFRSDINERVQGYGYLYCFLRKYAHHSDDDDLIDYKFYLLSRAAAMSFRNTSS